VNSGMVKTETGVSCEEDGLLQQREGYCMVS
jgi:hypothetical protein